MTRLFRPLGLDELALIWDSGCREFPPRLPDQPIFYPVTSAEYVIQIARDWNTKSSSYGGYVNSFDVDDAYLSKFDRHVVGSAVHQEYWIPAKELPNFNQAIRGWIEVDAAFFGAWFLGFIPDEAGLSGKNAEEQFVILARSRDSSPTAFSLEISVNRKAVYLNCLFWLEHDFTAYDIDQNLKTATLAETIESWNHRRIEPALPAAFTSTVLRS